jgi:uncharacterized protein (DUF488 family)
VTVNSTSQRVLTVGHSNHPISNFLLLLNQHTVTTIADVRSVPYSQFAPQFSKLPLRKTLRAEGIKYAFLGRELGARSADPTCYENGRVRYDRLAQTDLFQVGLDRLVSGSDSETIAILCSEKDPLDCHRTLLVGRALMGRGLAIDHILSDGSLESYEDSMLRLLGKTGQPPPDLFTTVDERIDKALREQEARIAYVNKELARATDGTTT